ncbi:hypothetical protein Ga0100231_022675 [Opitutaceae bacterium TAV4]|nr:hypothetical protein Ga0100231_022675 [Opitutaceae bacterium TAV4]
MRAFAFTFTRIRALTLTLTLAHARHDNAFRPAPSLLVSTLDARDAWLRRRGRRRAASPAGRIRIVTTTKNRRACHSRHRHHHRCHRRRRNARANCPPIPRSAQRRGRTQWHISNRPHSPAPPPPPPPPAAITQPIIVQLERTDNGQRLRILSYSGRTIRIELEDGTTLAFDANALLTGEGDIILAGKDFLWSPAHPAHLAGYEIHATPLNTPATPATNTASML